MKTNKRRSLTILVVMFIIGSYLLCSELSIRITASAAGSTASGRVMVQVNYLTETIYVSPGVNHSTKLYFSQDKMKTWELIESSNGTLDVTVFMKSSDNIIYFKGNRDTEVVELLIPRENGSLKVQYKNQNGTGYLNFENANGPLEYRKGSGGDWRDYSGTLDLSNYEITGYTLQFRQKATVSNRAGRIVNVKITKRKVAPRLKVDYSKMMLSGLKPGETLYRKSDTTEWKVFLPINEKDKAITLYDFLFPQNLSQNLVPLPAACYEFMMLYPKTGARSAIGVIEFTTQPPAPVGKAILNNTTLSFPDASKDKVYEYVIMHSYDTLDLKTVKWKKVSNNKEIVIKKIGSALPIPGDIIYYRLASVTDKTTKTTTPASMYTSVVITNVIYE